MFGVHEESYEDRSRELNRKFCADNLAVVRGNHSMALDQVTKSKQEESDTLRKAKKE